MLNENILISFCIPTYNRVDQLLELVELLLKIKREDIEVVVTDNCSTDDTNSRLHRINDRRLRVCKNTEPIPPFLNMIEAIFNGNGKYIFYCNDREIVYPDKIEEFIGFIENKEFAFVHVKQKSKWTRYNYNIFTSQFDSLNSQRCTHHPSGMVFNGTLLRSRVDKNKYKRYLKDHYTYSFLMRDVIQFGDSAIYDFGCWTQRHPNFLRTNVSGSNPTKILYYYPEISFMNIKDVFEQIFYENDYSLTWEQCQSLALYIIDFFANNIFSYKYYSMSKTESAHYNVLPKYVSYFEMKKYLDEYFKLIDRLLKEYGFYNDIIWKWRSERVRIRVMNMHYNAMVDYKKFIKHEDW